MNAYVTVASSNKLDQNQVRSSDYTLLGSTSSIFGSDPDKLLTEYFAHFESTEPPTNFLSFGYLKLEYKLLHSDDSLGSIIET